MPMSSMTIRSARIRRPIARVDAVVGAVAAQQRRERLQRVPGDRLAAVDREVPERLDQVALAGPRRPADTQRFGAADPFQRPERLLGGFRDR
jgi:hypothetical protein